MIRGFLPLSCSNPLDIRVVCKEITQRLGHLEGIVGRADLFGDKSSLLIELTSWEAMKSIRPLVEEAVSLSPKWGLIKTNISDERWGESLSNLMRDNPQQCALRVTWRPSMHGGRPWAMPAATSQQIQAVRVQAKQKLQSKGANGEVLDDSMISIQGGLGPAPLELLNHVMSEVQDKLSIQLKKSEGDRLREIGEWLICLDPSTGKPNGKIKVRTGSSTQARELEGVVKHCDVTIKGTSIPISVSNFSTMSLPKCLGNN